MFKKILLTVFILMAIATISLPAAQEKESVSALFFQYSFDNDFRQIDSIGGYMRSSQFDDSIIGSSWGATLELPIGYYTNKMAMKYSGFGGASLRFKISGDDNILTIGPSVAATVLSDTSYLATLFDLGIFFDMATSYPVSEKVKAIIGCSLIYDIARYYIIETSSVNSSDFEQDFSQLSGKLYIGFSVSK